MAKVKAEKSTKKSKSSMNLKPLTSKISKISKVMGTFVFAFIFLLFIGIDIASKYATQKYIPYMTHEAQWYPYKGIGIFEDFFGIEFAIVHAKNHGAAWGLFANFQEYLVAFRVIFVLGLALYIKFINKNRRLTFPLFLVFIGAFGNILDYFLYGHVVDMFHFVFWGYRYPVFNVADSLICIGVGSLFIVSMLEKQGIIRCKA